jgi:uncharacterized membrane protein
VVEDQVRFVSKHETPPELNQWAESLAEAEIDYLLEEAHRNHVSEQLSFSTLDSRVVAIVGWAIVGVGTLLIAGDLEFKGSARGISAYLVVIGASIAVLAGVVTLWPRNWASGLDIEWYSKFNWSDAYAMKARSLANLTHGSGLNRETIAKRNLLLQISAIGLVAEFGALVVALLLKAN